MAKTSRRMKVDLTGVESFVKCAEGEHLVKIMEAKEGVSQAGNDTINLKLQVLKGTSKGAVVYDTVTMTEKALWRLKMLLDAIGQKSEGKIVIDLDKIEGKTCIINVVHEPYEGKIKAKVDEFKKVQASSSSDEDDDDFDDDFDDEEEEEDEKPKKNKKQSSTKKKSKKVDEPEDEDDEDFDEDFEDDEDEEEEPAPKTKKSKEKEKKKDSKKNTSKKEKSSKKPTKKDSEPEEEDDEEWDEEDEEWDEE